MQSGGWLPLRSAHTLIDYPVYTMIINQQQYNKTIQNLSIGGVRFTALWHFAKVLRLHIVHTVSRTPTR